MTPDAGTPGWRERLAAAIAACESQGADGFAGTHHGANPLIPLADLRAALAASSPSCDCDKPADPPDIPHRPWCASVTGFHALPAGVQVDREALAETLHLNRKHASSGVSAQVFERTCDECRIIADIAVAALAPLLATSRPGVDREAALEALTASLTQQFGCLYVIEDDPEDPGKIIAIDLRSTVEHIILPALAPLLGSPEVET